MIIDDQPHHCLGRETVKTTQPVDGVVALAKDAGATRINRLGNLCRNGNILRPPARDVRGINTLTMQQVAQDPDFVSGFCYMNPYLDARSLLEEIEPCVTEGNLIGLKVEIDLNCRDERMDPLLDCAGHGCPAVERGQGEGAMAQRGGRAQARCQGSRPMITPSVDVNVSLGFWPFHRFELRTPAALAGHMRRLGIQRALVSAVESILYPDPDAYDEQCFHRLTAHPELVPVKTVNPTLGNWKESLLAFHDRYRLGAIKLFPNYHYYDLADERVHAAANLARRLKLPILVAARVEDERQHYWHMQVPGVPVSGIEDLAKAVPGARFIVLNEYRWGMTIPDKPSNLFFDFSFAEQPDTLLKLTESVPAKNLVFGSATPFLTTEAALGKLRLGTLPDKDRERIVANGDRLFKHVL